MHHTKQGILFNIVKHMKFILKQFCKLPSSIILSKATHLIHIYTHTLVGRCTLFANRPACKDQQRGRRGDEMMPKW